MSNASWTFGQPLFLWALLLAVPAVAGLFYWSWRVRRELIRRFVGSRLVEALTVGVSPARQITRMALLGAALVFLLVALARPQHGYTWEDAKQRGLDILIVLDTSRSMLAADVPPNRLERAKLAAIDLMNQARNDRLGLVVFAGNAFLQTPLTLDDQAFRQGLDAVDVGIIPEGGTAIATALNTAAASFEKGNDNNKVIVLFTDGEDHDEDSETVAAAKKAAAAGIHIYTVGVGTAAGELLRIKDEQGNYGYVKDDQGNVVKSRLNENLLREIATDSGGFYIPLVGPSPMQALYSRCLAPLPKTETTSRLTRVYNERYHWFLAIAMACLIAEYLLPESSRRARRGETAARQAAASMVALAILLTTTRVGASPSSAFHDYESGNFKSSLDEYSRLAEKNTNDYRLYYDAGTAAYQAKQLEKAEKLFNSTLGSQSVTPDTATQEHTYYNLGNTEFRLGEAQSDPEKKEERWKQAIDNYTHALKVNTNQPDADAKNNLEYVKYKLEELKKQQQQQQQKQDKNQKKDKNQKQDQQQQQQQQQGQQDQQKDSQQQKDQQQKDQQNHQQQAKNQEQQKQDREKQQANAQKKQDEQQQAGAKPEDKKDDSQEQQEAQAVPGQMSPQEARQMLEGDKEDEKTLIFSPENKQNQDPRKKIKDW